MAGKVRRSTVLAFALPFAVAMVAGLFSASCEPEPKKDLSGRIDSVMLARQHPSASVDQIVGGFDIYLELGEAAPGPADVAPGNGNFVLVRESDQKHMTGLSVDCLTTRHLNPGDKACVHVTVAEQGAGQ
jgi:hypothetical protein